MRNSDVEKKDADVAIKQDVYKRKKRLPNNSSEGACGERGRLSVITRQTIIDYKLLIIR